MVGSFVGARARAVFWPASKTLEREKERKVTPRKTIKKEEEEEKRKLRKPVPTELLFSLFLPTYLLIMVKAALGTIQNARDFSVLNIPTFPREGPTKCVRNPQVCRNPSAHGALCEDRGKAAAAAAAVFCELHQQCDSRAFSRAARRQRM